MSQLVTRIDTTKDDITISFVSINKESEPSAAEKLLVSRLVKAMGTDPLLPVSKISTFSHDQEQQR